MNRDYEKELEAAAERGMTSALRKDAESKAEAARRKADIENANRAIGAFATAIAALFAFYGWLLVNKSTRNPTIFCTVIFLAFCLFVAMNYNRSLSTPSVRSAESHMAPSTENQQFSQQGNADTDTAQQSADTSLIDKSMPASAEVTQTNATNEDVSTERNSSSTIPQLSNDTGKTTALYLPSHSPDLQPTGVLGLHINIETGEVKEVYPESDALSQGVLQGDLIVAVDGIAYSKSLFLEKHLGQPGSSLKLTLSRDGQTQTKYIARTDLNEYERYHLPVRKLQ